MKKYQSFLDNPETKIIKDQSLLKFEAIKPQIRIIAALKELIPPLLADEYNQLKRNIEANGCREALLVWETSEDKIGLDTDANAYILIDGHNRHAICRELKKDYKIHLLSFNSLAEVKDFMIDNQLGRRNISAEQASYLRGMKYLLEKQKKGKYLRNDHNGHSDHYGQETSIDHSEHHNGQNDHYDKAVMETTAKRLAKQYKLGEKTIRRDAAFAEGLNKLSPELRQGILGGEIKVEKEHIQKLSKNTQKPDSIISLETVSAHKMVETLSPVDQTLKFLDKAVQALHKERNQASVKEVQRFVHQIERLLES